MQVVNIRLQFLILLMKLMIIKSLLYQNCCFYNRMGYYYYFSILELDGGYGCSCSGGDHAMSCKLFLRCVGVTSKAKQLAMVFNHILH